MSNSLLFHYISQNWLTIGLICWLTAILSILPRNWWLWRDFFSHYIVVCQIAVDYHIKLLLAASDLHSYNQPAQEAWHMSSFLLLSRRTSSISTPDVFVCVDGLRPLRLFRSCERVRWLNLRFRTTIDESSNCVPVARMAFFYLALLADVVVCNKLQVKFNNSIYTILYSLKSGWNEGLNE